MDYKAVRRQLIYLIQASIEQHQKAIEYVRFSQELSDIENHIVEDGTVKVGKIVMDTSLYLAMEIKRTGLTDEDVILLLPVEDPVPEAK